MAEGGALAAVLGGVRHRLPAGAERLAAPPAIRPLPGAAPPLLGLVAQGGELVPAFAPLSDPGGDPPRDWAWLPAPLRAVLGASAIVAAEPGDAPLPAALLAARPAPWPAPTATPTVAPTVAETAPAPQLPRAAPARAAVLRFTLGPLRFDLPLDAARHIVEMPRARPLPGGPEGALGLASTAFGEVLLLDPAWLARAPAPPAPLVAILEAEGCRLGLPCDGASPAEGGSDDAIALPARLGDPGLRQALRMAPRAVAAAPPPPVPQRNLVVAWAGGVRFALPAERVAAVLPPRRPDPPPPGAPRAIGGLCAHRSDVLPVLDGAVWLGRKRPGPPVARYMLRLAVTPPVALAIDGLPALHTVPDAALTPVADPDGLLEGIARLEGNALPICRAETIAGLATRRLP